MGFHAQTPVASCKRSLIVASTKDAKSILVIEGMYNTMETSSEKQFSKTVCVCTNGISNQKLYTMLLNNRYALVV